MTNQEKEFRGLIGMYSDMGGLDRRQKAVLTGEVFDRIDYHTIAFTGAVDHELLQEVEAQELISKSVDLVATCFRVLMMDEYKTANNSAVVKCIEVSLLAQIGLLKEANYL